MPPPPGTATWSDGQGLRMYVDGKLETQKVNPDNVASRAAINYGVFLGRSNNIYLLSRNGEFYMDELLFWEMALSDDEVTKLFETYGN